MDYRPLIERWQNGDLQRWADALPAQLEKGLSHQRYGDLQRWLDVLAALPNHPVAEIMLEQARVGVRSAEPLPAQEQAALKEALLGLHPWRKGPFELFGVHIDTEWRSDWKWDRLRDRIAPLQDRRVLDVGCGSGYHGWRMRGEGAAEVIGIDPTPLFIVQFWALQKYLQQDAVWVLPAGIEDVPEKLQAFDTTAARPWTTCRNCGIACARGVNWCWRPWSSKAVPATPWCPKGATRVWATCGSCPAATPCWAGCARSACWIRDWWM